MRFIPIDDLEEVYNDLNGADSFNDWIKTADDHLTEIRALAPKKRGKYWSANNHWKELYTTLSRLSGHKCWYSESPENSSEWEIEHYRPKALSKNEKGEKIREDGYWWLSYKYKNYRLAGSLVNKLRNDRFTNEYKVIGKGNYFPLEEDSDIAIPEDEFCTDEKPLLLDPTKARDCTLLSFDQNGDVFPTFGKIDNELLFKKADISIRYYGLDHSPIKRGRKKVWEKCATIVEPTKNFIKTYITKQKAIDDKIEKCYHQLALLARKKEPYSMVVSSFVKEKIKDKDYSWLEDALIILQ